MKTPAVPRRTLAAPVELVGNAVRTHGGPVTLRLLPGDDGFWFVRDDNGSRLRAHIDNVLPVPNATALGRDGRPQFLFTEHVLSALVGLGLTDAEIHVDSVEVPLLDGSALPIVAALQAVGAMVLPGELPALGLDQPLVLADGERYLSAEPAEVWSASYELVHPHPLIGRQAVDVGWASYSEQVAPARTFATREELEALTAKGLIRGGSEDNLLVVYPDRLSAPLRLPDECARHKVLDLIGDLALLGRPLAARLTARRTGHAENQALVRELLKRA